MNSTGGRNEPWPLWPRIVIFLLIFAVAVLVGHRILDHRRLPIFHPRQLDIRLVDPAVRDQEGEHHIKDFELTDQLGRNVDLSAVAGKVIVADFFFTTCGSICPKMTKQMGRVQEEFMDDDHVILLSHSVIPEVDSVPVLKAYADLHGADPDRWLLMTGDRKQIYALARRSYFAALEDGDGGPDDLVHTENFVLVDTLRRIRGFYDGTSPVEVDRMIQDIHILLEETP